MMTKVDDAAADIADITATDEAYTKIKEWIATMVLRPGSTIREADLQERVGVRRTPLREALHRLADQRMLTIYPRHGIVIATLGVNEISEIYEVRMCLEPPAAGYAALRRTEAELAELHVYADELRAARAAGDWLWDDRYHEHFHQLIIRMARNRTLAEYINHALILNRWLWNIYEDRRGERVAGLTDHDQILQSITTGDPKAAEVAVREHILIAKEQLFGAL